MLKNQHLTRISILPNMYLVRRTRWTRKGNEMKFKKFLVENGGVMALIMGVTNLLLIVILIVGACL